MTPIVNCMHKCNLFKSGIIWDVIPPLGLQFMFTKDVEVEEKFKEGMLSKMSKITDLISKLDGFAEGSDKARVEKC